jgi:hypothetical protein
MGFAGRGVDVLTSQEDLTADWDDDVLLDRSTALGRVLFSMDTDLRREAAARQRRGQSFAGVVAADQLGVTIGQCIEELELIANVYDPPDMADRLEYLPIR